CGFPLSQVRSAPSSLTFVCQLTNAGVGFHLPVDIEGSPAPGGTTLPAPLGTPEYYVSLYSGAHTLQLFTFAPDFSAGTATLTNVVNLSAAPAQDVCAN